MTQKKDRKQFLPRNLQFYIQRLGGQSLTVKLVLAISVIVCLIVALGTAWLVQVTSQGIAETSVTAALYQTQLMKSKLIETMINDSQRHEELQAMLSEDKSQLKLDEVNIFNPEGEIRFSSLSSKIGQHVDLSATKVERLTSDDALIHIVTSQGEEKLRILHPIRGGSQCASCHQNQKSQVIGGIELYIPLKPIYHRFMASRFFLVLFALAIIVVSALVIRALVHHIVKRPIEKLIGAMEKTEGGGLEVRAKVHEDPDLRKLAITFNAMLKNIEGSRQKIEEQYQKELSQSNRLASLGQFISNISHEIKNPLAAISSALHALRSEFTTNEDQQIFNQLTLQIERIERTVNNLLRYARQEPPHFEMCSISEIIDQALALAEQQIKDQGIKVSIDRRAGKDMIWGDEGQLQQVFLNLYLNAIQAMPGGGQIRTVIRAPEAGDEPGASFPENGMIVEIQDTGTGIKIEPVERIFEPFFTTKKRGTGLGLSVVKGIIEAHRGMIRVKKLQKLGTSMILWFPNQP